MVLRLAKGLNEQELTRAHYITTFYMLGLGTGIRERQYANMALKRPETVRYMLSQADAGAAWIIDSPFFHGFVLGWKFEPMKSEPCPVP